MRQALVDYLAADAGVAAVAGELVSTTWRKQGDPVPAATVTRVGGVPDRTYKGPSGLVESHAQVDCYGATQAEAADLAAAVKAAVQVAAATIAAATGGAIQGVFVESEQDFPLDGELPERILRTMLTLQVWHPES